MKLNNIFRGIVLSAVIGSAVTGCTEQIKFGDSFIEKTPGGDVTIDTIFNSAEYTQQFLTGIYKNQYYGLPFKAGDGNSHSYFSGQIEAMSDCWHNPTSKVAIYNLVYDDYMTAASSNAIYGFDKENIWEMVHACYLLMENIDRVPDMDEATKKQYVAEAKCLIASSYFNLFRMYGGLPLVTHSYDVNGDKLDAPRASVEKTLNFILKLYDEAINSGALPFAYSDDDVTTMKAHWTKAAAMAMKCRVLQFAASPLFNGGYAEALEVKNNDGEYLFPPYDPEKWKIAKKRLEEVLEDAEACGYRLYKVYQTDGSIDADRSVYEVFQAYNDEIIWATGRNYYHTGSQDGVMEENTTPRDLYKGWAHVCVTQESVDGFFMKDGLTIDDPGTGYDESGFTEVVNPCNDRKRTDKNIFTMYADREPRFYAAVTYEGKSWHIQPRFNYDWGAGFAKGEGSDNSVGDYPRNGYLLYKFKNRQIMYTGDYIKKWARPSILFRLADFYLYYAEVCNEIDPEDECVIDYLDKIRERAGLLGYRELAATGKKNIIGDRKLQRRAIQQERRVELFAEGQRFFDIRRWMIGDVVKDIYGVKITKKGSKYSYTPVKIQTRVWEEKMNLYPIAQSEIYKNGNLTQNDGWE